MLTLGDFCVLHFAAYRGQRQKGGPCETDPVNPEGKHVNQPDSESSLGVTHPVENQGALQLVVEGDRIEVLVMFFNETVVRSLPLKTVKRVLEEYFSL